jgi:hypothetical protein
MFIHMGHFLSRPSAGFPTAALAAVIAPLIASQREAAERAERAERAQREAAERAQREAAEHAAAAAKSQGEVVDLLRQFYVREAVKDVEFSKASSRVASEAIFSVGVGLGGLLALPDDLARFMPSVADLAPFQWSHGRGEKRETDESGALLALLENWVKRDAVPPVPNVFLDVQAGPPMRMRVEGVANFSGVPDAIVVGHRIGSRDEAAPFAASAVFAVDWKRQSVMQQRGRVAAIGHVHALAFASARDYSSGQPAFFTDLAAGFRCWIVLGSKLYFFHDDARQVDLSLAEGVALMRYCIACAADGAALGVSDSAALTCVRASPGSRATAAGGAGSAVPTPAPEAGPGGGARDGKAGAGSAPAKSRGGGTTATDESPESEATTGEDGVNADLGVAEFRAVAMSIAHDLARGGGFSLEGWE